MLVPALLIVLLALWLIFSGDDLGGDFGYQIGG